MDQLLPDPPRDALAGVLDDLLTDQMEANRYAARRAEGMRDALAYARSHSHIYSDLSGDDGVRAAEGAVLLDISLRLHLSENHIRNIACAAGSAITRLPYLWRRAREGFAAFALVEANTDAIVRLLPAADADPATRAAAAAAIAMVDDATGDWAVALTATAFRRRLRILVDRLDPRDATTRHTAALADRRVTLDDEENGMTWLHLLLPTIDALAIKRRLTATAKHTQRAARDGRCRDQIRADLASAWLRGEGTPTAVKTKVFVTIPVGVLTGAAIDADTGRCTTCGGSGFPEAARIVGGPTLDPLAAKQLFLDTPAFRRVVTDPVRRVVVDLDRRHYRPTGAQRDWLILQHGTCARDGCTRLAQDSDIDHITPWATGGPTNLAGLRPLCPPEHTTRHATRITFRSRPNGTVEVRTPTGHTSSEPPPF